MSNTDKKKTEKQTTKNWFSEGFIIASSPIVAYMFTFAYEAGFARVFGIPLEFITLNLKRVFIVASVLLTIVGLLFWLANLIFMVSPKETNPIYRGFIRLSLPVLLFVVFIFLFGPVWQEWIVLVIVLAIMIWVEFGFPLITQRHKGSYREKLEAQEKVEEQVKTEDVDEELEEVSKEIEEVSKVEQG